MVLPRKSLRRASTGSGPRHQIRAGGLPPAGNSGEYRPDPDGASLSLSDSSGGLQRIAALAPRNLVLDGSMETKSLVDSAPAEEQPIFVKLDETLLAICPPLTVVTPAPVVEGMSRPHVARAPTSRPMWRHRLVIRRRASRRTVGCVHVMRFNFYVLAQIGFGRPTVPRIRKENPMAGRYCG